MEKEDESIKGEARAWVGKLSTETRVDYDRTPKADREFFAELNSMFKEMDEKRKYTLK